jgi:ABC-2 type transport system permease protein
MRPMLTLIRREFTAYFLSPVAYVVLAVFLLVTGRLFYLAVTLLTEEGPIGIEQPMQALLGDDRFWLVFLFIPPLLTMRLFAEERAAGTLEMLLTAPLRDWQVVGAKFVACFAFYIMMWLPTLVYLPVLIGIHRVELHQAWTDNSISMLFGIGLSGLYLLLLVAPVGPGVRLGGVILSQLVMLGALTALLATRGQTTAGLVLLGAGMGILVLWIGIPLLIGRLSGYGIDAIVNFILWLSLALMLASAAYHGWRHFVSDDVSLIQINSKIDQWPAVTSYLGVMLAGAMFLALGMFVSSLVKSQMVAALISLVVGLGFIVAAFWRPDLDTGNFTYRLIYFFSVPLHFSHDFTRGLIDTRQLVLYVSVAAFCLFLTVRSLESRRWR